MKRGIRRMFCIALGFLELSFSLFIGAGFLCFVSVFWIMALRLSLWVEPLIRGYKNFRVRVDRFFGRC